MSATSNKASPGLMHRTKSDLAHAFIRERICTGELEPGARLTLAMLAELTGLSQMPIREATLRLEAEGLIVATPHKDMRVAPLLRRDALELFQIREALEGLSASLACARRGVSLVDELESANAAFARAHHKADHSAMGDANWHFHRVILDAADNVQLSALLDGVWAKCVRFRLGYRLIPGRAAATVSEHERIVAAFRAGDAEGARLATTAHVSRASAELLALLAADESAGAGGAP